MFMYKCKIVDVANFAACVLHDEMSLAVTDSRIQILEI